jgi:hypothetical protein
VGADALRLKTIFEILEKFALNAVVAGLFDQRAQQAVGTGAKRPRGGLGHIVYPGSDLRDETFELVFCTRPCRHVRP